MDKDIGLMLGILPTSILSALFIPSPVSATIATIITLFYAAQIFGSITIYLHREVNPAFYPFTICYVCSAVGGTWITGLILQLAGIPLIPKIFIIYLAGQSALAIAQQSQYIYKASTEANQKLVSYLVLVVIGAVELAAGYTYTDYTWITVLGAYLAGVFTLKNAELFDRIQEKRHETKGTPYYEVEENLAIFFLTLIVLLILSTIV